jgi:hypothetical protein
VKDIATRRTKVEIFNHDNQKINGFYLGSPSNEYNGNFMLMEGGKSPFIVNVPGFEGFVSAAFFLNEAEWRSRAVFSFNPGDIKSVYVKYSVQPDSSFTLVKNAENIFELISGNKPSENLNPEIANYYLKQYNLLNSESLLLNNDKRDSLLATEPVCAITVIDNSGKATDLKIYYRPVTERTKMQFSYENKPMQFDMDKFYGIYGNNQSFAIIQNFVFGKLFVGPYYFYRQKPANANMLIESQ